MKDRHIDVLHQCFAQYDTIDQVVIYGSRAQGNYRPGSDIDLTIVGQLSYSDLMKLDNELDDLLLPFKIDLSLLEKIANPDLILHIERVGKILYDKSKKELLLDPPVAYKAKSQK